MSLLGKLTSCTEYDDVGHEAIMYWSPGVGYVLQFAKEQEATWTRGGGNVNTLGTRGGCTAGFSSRALAALYKVCGKLLRHSEPNVQYNRPGQNVVCLDAVIDPGIWAALRHTFGTAWPLWRWFVPSTSATSTVRPRLDILKVE